jgi:hypothetical protein
MTVVISLRISDSMHLALITYARAHGFDNTEDFVKEILREKLFDNGKSDILRINKLPKCKSISNNSVEPDMIGWEDFRD